MASGLATALLKAAGGRTGFEAALGAKAGTQSAVKEAAQGYWKNLLRNVPPHALAEIPKELPDELFSQISSALATNPKADIGQVVGDFIQRSPELMGAVALMGGAGGAMKAQQDARSSPGQAQTESARVQQGGDDAGSQQSSSGGDIPQNTTSGDGKPLTQPSTPPLSVADSQKLIDNVSKMPPEAQQHPQVQADLEQARKVVAEDAASKAQPSTPPLSVADSQKLIENVSKMPPEAQQHPQVQADLEQARQVLQDHVQKLETQKEPLSEAQKRELADAKAALARQAPGRAASIPDTGKETPPADATPAARTQQPEPAVRPEDAARPAEATPQSTRRPQPAGAPQTDAPDGNKRPQGGAGNADDDPNGTPHTDTTAEAVRNHGDPQEKTRSADTSPTASTARPSTPPRSVQQSQRLLENVSRLPAQAQQHPTTRADVDQARQVVADHVQKLENQSAPLSEGKKKELAEAKATLAQAGAPSYLNASSSTSSSAAAHDTQQSLDDESIAQKSIQSAPQTHDTGKTRPQTSNDATNAPFHFADKADTGAPFFSQGMPFDGPISHKTHAERRKENTQLLTTRPQRKHPFSNKVRVYVEGVHGEALRKAALLIDHAHDDGSTTEVAIRDKVTNPNALGNYQEGIANVRSDGPHPLMTSFHELGHHIALTMLDDAAIKRVLKAARDTSRWSELFKLKERNPDFDLDYYTDPHEVFARAYAQTIAMRTKDVESLTELQWVLKHPDVYFRQWPASQFDRLQKAVEAELRKIKWL